MKPTNAQILTINGGSSSIKFALYEVVKPLRRGLHGKVDRIGLALASPFTVNTMREETLKALADHGELGKIMAANGGGCEKVLAAFGKAGIKVDSLAAQLQDDGAKSFVKSWNELPAVIASKSAALKQAA